MARGVLASSCRASQQAYRSIADLYRLHGGRPRGSDFGAGRYLGMRSNKSLERTREG